MTRAEKMLFHQIHPLKLLTDFGTSFASSWLLWNDEWMIAVVVAFLPSVVVSGVLVNFANLERLRDSWFGEYVARRMVPRVVGQRIVGQLVAWIAAVTHLSWLVAFGYFIIVLAWLDGLWTPRVESARATE